jgi:MscS family membrane protein
MRVNRRAPVSFGWVAIAALLGAGALVAALGGFVTSVTAYLPAWLVTAGPSGLSWWHGFLLLGVASAAIALGAVLGRLTRRLLVRAASSTSFGWDDMLIGRLSGPIALGWGVALMFAGVPWLDLPGEAQRLVAAILRGALFVVFFWALARGVDVVGEALIQSPWGRTRPGSRSLVAVGARAGKLTVLALAIVALLAELGYPVASLIAGLGLGGLAFALAAQKTVENLFGAFSLAADQPIREGDFVKIEDFVGTVETIGLRSTRVRTLDRTLVSIPNGRLADMRLESFTARDRIRLSCFIGLVYETTAAQMRVILEQLEQVLRAHPRIWPDAVVVRFSAFGASSLDIEVMAWFQTSDYAEFQGYRQEVFLAFMDVVERNGSAFAFPTRTVHIANAARSRPSDGSDVN